VRIAVRVPGSGLGQRYMAISAWLDDNCGVGGWSITPAGTRGVLNDAMAVYVNTPTCAVAFIARWLVPGDPRASIKCARMSRRDACQRHTTSAPYKSQVTADGKAHHAGKPTPPAPLPGSAAKHRA
jgi:hypothetical protein